MYPLLFGFIETYYIAVALGVVACFLFLHIYAKKTGLSKRIVLSIEIGALLAIIAGVIFAILFQNLYDLIEKGASYTWTWAMTFYGGLIGGVGGFLAYYFFFILKQDGPCMRAILKIAPAMIAIAHSFGRLGCFLAGCCYGVETDSILGVTFPDHDHAVLPTNLFECLFLLLLAVGLLVLACSKKGDYSFSLYGIGYGAWRFAIEFFRGDHRGSFIPGISPSQFWSLLLIVGGIAYFFIMKKLMKKEGVTPLSFFPSNKE